MKIKEKKLPMPALLMIMPVLIMCLTGFSAEGSADINYNGKGRAVFTVCSELSEDEFLNRVNGFVKDINVVSGRNDILRTDSVRKNGDGQYQVSLHFRRIDKVRLRGAFLWYPTEFLKRDQSSELDQLYRWELGDINCQHHVFYDGLRGNVRLMKPREGGPEYVIGPCNAEGKETSVKKMASEISEKARMMVFQICDTMGVVRVRVNLPGKILYTGGENVKITGESSVEITPVKIKAKVTHIDPDTLEAVVSEEDVNFCMGYVAIKQGMSPVAIFFICAGCAVFAGLVTAACVYFYIRGKRVIAQTESAKETRLPEDGHSGAGKRGKGYPNGGGKDE